MTMTEFMFYSRHKKEEDKLKWNHTATLMALHANMNRDPKKAPQPYSAEDFHPYSDKRSLEPELPSEEMFSAFKNFNPVEVPE